MDTTSNQMAFMAGYSSSSSLLGLSPKSSIYTGGVGICQSSVLSSSSSSSSSHPNLFAKRSSFVSFPLSTITTMSPPSSSSILTPSFTHPHPHSHSHSSRSHFAVPAKPCMTLDQSSSSSSPTSLDEEVESGRRDYLEGFIRQGPIFQVAELEMRPEDEASCVTDASTTCLDDWLRMGSILWEALGVQANDVRVYQYYLPIYFWILRELDRHLDNERQAPAGTKHRPFILGFCCPQGGGKTTMTTFMQALLVAMGKSCQIASLDDFYVTNKQQNAIAAQYPSNRLMQFRGMPGTHDVDLLVDTLDALRHSHPVAIPKYDKSKFGGRGDRAGKDSWKHISDKTDVVLLEGWCLGFEPVPTTTLVDSDLEVVNEALADFDRVYKRLDGLFLIEIANMDWVYEWRLQAERGARAAGKTGLSDEQVIDFVDRFMPAYKQYSQQLYRRPTPLIPKHELHIEIDEERRPVHRNGIRNGTVANGNGQ